MLCSDGIGEDHVLANIIYTQYLDIGSILLYPVTMNPLFASQLNIVSF